MKSVTAEGHTVPPRPVSKGAWLRDSVGWWYCNASYTVNNWQSILMTGGIFNAAGYIVTGWIGGRWYYCGDDGAMSIPLHRTGMGMTGLGAVDR